MAAIIFTKLSPLILIALGFLPSILWLLLYLREDCHPEPKRLVLKVFAWGMLIAPLAVVVQYLFLQVWSSYVETSALQRTVASWLGDSGSLARTGAVFTFGNLAGLAVIEEYLKYLVVKTEVEGEPDFDEPVDAVEYLIIAALGFAAVENLLIAFSLAPSGTAAAGAASAISGIAEASRVLGIRFLGATLLHASSSATVGYFLARKLFAKKRLGAASGLVFGTALHTVFNYFILVRSEVRMLTVVAAAGAMLVFTLWLLARARRLTASHRLRLQNV